MQWSALALGWALPVPSALGRQGLWSALAAVGLFGWAHRRSRPVAWVLAIGMALMPAATHSIHGFLGIGRLAALALITLPMVLIALLAGRRATHLPLAPRAVLADVATGLLALPAAALRRTSTSS